MGSQILNLHLNYSIGITMRKGFPDVPELKLGFLPYQITECAEVVPQVAAADDETHLT